MPPTPDEIHDWWEELRQEIPLFSVPDGVQLELFGDEGRPQPPAEAG